MTGRELSNLGAELLRACGFVVVVFNANKRVRTRNFVDALAFRAGHTWLIEIKGEGDRLRPGQREFAERLDAHLGDCLHYLIISRLEQFEEIVNG